MVAYDQALDHRIESHFLRHKAAVAVEFPCGEILGGRIEFEPARTPETGEGEQCAAESAALEFWDHKELLQPSCLRKKHHKGDHIAGCQREPDLRLPGIFFDKAAAPSLQRARMPARRKRGVPSVKPAGDHGVEIGGRKRANEGGQHGGQSLHSISGMGPRALAPAVL